MVRKKKNNGAPLQFIAIASAVGIILLMCVISYCEAAGRCAGRRTRMLVNTRNLARKGGLKAHRPRDIENGKEHRKDSLESEAIEVMKNIGTQIKKETRDLKSGSKMMLLLSSICPCCGLSAEERDQLRGRGGDDDEVEIRREVDNKFHHELLDKKTPKKKAINEETDYETVEGEELLQWERHETVKDGKSVVYYYNYVTDKSQWHNPFPGKQIKKADNSTSAGADSRQSESGKRKAPVPPRTAKATGDSSQQSHGGGKTHQIADSGAQKPGAIHSARKKPVPPSKPKSKPNLISQDIDKDI